MVRRALVVTMKRIPFGGLKPQNEGEGEEEQEQESDNEENPLRGIETDNPSGTIPDGFPGKK